jgi:putative ABC transport system substrate-binding protein
MLGAAAAWPRYALAQSRTIPVIGFLNTASPQNWAPYVAAFRAGLNEGGYAEGRNVEIEFRWAEGRYERLPALAADLVARRVTVIAATGGSASAHAAREATRTIPIVFISGEDPVASGLVVSLGRPGGNVTGVSTITRDLTSKRLELLEELVPTATTVALLLNPDSPTSNERPAIEAAIRAHGQQSLVFEARTQSDIDAAFASFAKSRPNALLLFTDALFDLHSHQLVALAARLAVPTIYGWREDVDAGGLVSYGPSHADLYRQAGGYVDRVLDGARPAELPALLPTRLELVINLKTAKTLGLAIPPSFLARADEAVE